MNSIVVRIGSMSVLADFEFLVKKKRSSFKSPTMSDMTMSPALSNDHGKELGQRRVKTGPVLEINEIARIKCSTIVI